MDTMIRAMVQYHVRIPRELVLLSKQMLYLEGAAQTLAPEVPTCSRSSRSSTPR